MTTEKPGRVSQEHSGERSSHGEHGGNRGGSHDKDDEKQRSDPAAGKDPHRGGRRAGQ